VTRALIGGIATTVIGLIYLFLAFQIRASALADSTGPAGLPKAYGMIVIGLGIILSIEALIRGPGAEDDRRHDHRAILRAGGLFLIGVAYLLVVPYAGYVSTIALLIIAVAVYQGVARSPRLLVIGGGGALALWAIFTGLLGIPMPAGLLAGLF
jgi:hypothetical protein